MIGGLDMTVAVLVQFDDLFADGVHPFLRCLCIHLPLGFGTAARAVGSLACYTLQHIFARIDLVTMSALLFLLLLRLVVAFVLVVGLFNIVSCIHLVPAHDFDMAKPAAEVAPFFAVPTLHLRVLGLSATSAMPSVVGGRG